MICSDSPSLFHICAKQWLTFSSPFCMISNWLFCLIYLRNRFSRLRTTSFDVLPAWSEARAHQRLHHHHHHRHSRLLSKVSFYMIGPTKKTDRPVSHYIRRGEGEKNTRRRWTNRIGKKDGGEREGEKEEGDLERSRREKRKSFTHSFSFFWR